MSLRFELMMVWVIVMKFKEGFQFTGYSNPLHKTQKLNLEVSPHRAGNFKLYHAQWVCCPLMWEKKRERLFCFLYKLVCHLELTRSVNCDLVNFAYPCSYN